MLTGRAVFEIAPSMLSSEEFDKVIGSIKANLTKAMSGNDAKETTSIIKACLRLDPADRPTAFRLIGYRWVQTGIFCSCEWCPSNPLVWNDGK